MAVPVGARGAADGVGNDGCGIIVQKDGYGRVRGARKMAFGGES